MRIVGWLLGCVLLAGCGSDVPAAPFSAARDHVTISTTPTGLSIFGPGTDVTTGRRTEFMKLGVTPITLPMLPGAIEGRPLSLQVEYKDRRFTLNVQPNRSYHMDLTGSMPSIRELTEPKQ